MKIIFLDIDGVLNSRNTDETFMGIPFVSEDKILLLKEIIGATGSEIVLSSSWRLGWVKKEKSITTGMDVWYFDALKEKLNEFGIDFFGYTDDLGHRGFEITRWLKNHAQEQIESYIVIDDMDARELIPHENRLVQTATSYGLTESEVEEAISLLNENK